jgi:hypothetical protein
MNWPLDMMVASATLPDVGIVHNLMWYGDCGATSKKKIKKSQMQPSMRRTVHSVPIQYGPPYYGLFPPGGGCFGSFWRASSSSRRVGHVIRRLWCYIEEKNKKFRMQPSRRRTVHSVTIQYGLPYYGLVIRRLWCYIEEKNKKFRMQPSRRRTVHSVPIQYGPPYYGLFPPGGGVFGSFWREQQQQAVGPLDTPPLAPPFLSPADREVLDWCSGIRPSPLYPQAGAQPWLRSTEQRGLEPKSTQKTPHHRTKPYMAPATSSARRVLSPTSPARVVSIARLAPILSPGSRASPRRPVHGGGVPASSTIPSRSRSRLRRIPRFLSSLHTQILCVRAHTLGL